ncbi:MAG: hypothetical protein IKZ02_00315 [Alphaproteobacteria bacterium]|nr:hypothetical protein [Alphaproteobacteria bacterium]
MFFSRKGNRLADMICGRSPELTMDLEGICVPCSKRAINTEQKPVKQTENVQPESIQPKHITTGSVSPIYRAKQAKSDFQNG